MIAAIKQQNSTEVKNLGLFLNLESIHNEEGFG
jgi:hypothetical protein